MAPRIIGANGFWLAHGNLRTPGEKLQVSVIEPLSNSGHL